MSKSDTHFAFNDASGTIERRVTLADTIANSNNRSYIRDSLIDTAVHHLTSLVPRIKEYTDPSKKSCQYLQQLTEDIETLKDTQWYVNEQSANLETLGRMGRALGAEETNEALPQDVQEELGACLDVLDLYAEPKSESLHTMRDKAVKHAKDLEQSIAAARSHRLISGELSLVYPRREEEMGSDDSFDASSKIAPIMPTWPLQDFEIDLQGEEHGVVKVDTESGEALLSTADTGGDDVREKTYGRGGTDGWGNHWEPLPLTKSVKDEEPKTEHDAGYEDFEFL